MYRKKAAAVVINDEGKFLLLQLQIYDVHQWNIPGGGIDEGETPEETILRELKEELGCEKFEILERSPVPNRYDWPQEVVDRRFADTGTLYLGQDCTQFVVRFLGEDSDIQLQDKEIRKHIWVSLDDLKSHLVFPGQWENIKKVISSSSILSAICR